MNSKSLSVRDYVKVKFEKANQHLIKCNDNSLKFHKGNTCIFRKSGFIIRAEYNKIECDSDYGQWRARLEVQGVTRVVKDVRPMNQKALLCTNKMLSPEEQK